MRKRMVLVALCVVGVVGACLALTVLGGKSQPLASFTYLGTVTNLTGRYGRFSISNCCDRPIHCIPGLVEFYENGRVCRAQSPGSGRMDLQPHRVESFQFALPAGVTRWHGLVNVGQEKKGFASLPLRMKWTAHYGFRYALANGILSPKGKIHDGGLVATPEVEE
jgi:hypothetical protein